MKEGIKNPKVWVEKTWPTERRGGWWYAAASMESSWLKITFWWFYAFFCLFPVCALCNTKGAVFKGHWTNEFYQIDQSDCWNITQQWRTIICKKVSAVWIWWPMLRQCYDMHPYLLPQTGIYLQLPLLSFIVKTIFCSFQDNVNPMVTSFLCAMTNME